MNAHRSLILAVLVGIAGSSSPGQIVKKAQVGFRFLENPVAADAIGRGATGVAIPSNVMGLFWNPALIPWGPGTAEAGLHYTKGIADINTNAAAASYKLGSFGVIGLSLVVMDYGTFYGTRRAANADGFVETGTFSPQAFAVGVAFAQQISNRFSYGVQIKQATQDLGSAWVAPTGTSVEDPNLAIGTRGYRRSAIAFDVGAFYDFLYHGVRFGATLQNISKEVRFENEDIPMPFSVSFGATVEPLAFFYDGPEGQALLVTVESRHPRDFNEKMKIGAEYTLFGQFVLRSGYMTNYSERGFLAGVGVRHTIEGVPLRFDYAYQPFGVFGSVHHLTLSASY